MSKFGLWPILSCGALAIGSLAAPALAAPLPKPPQFAMCGVCHKVNPDEKSFLGPNLWAVGGSKAGTRPGFAFSPPMTKSGIVWNKKTLVAFITDPRATVPGTKMAYAGQKDPKVAAALADYVLSLK